MPIQEHQDYVDLTLGEFSSCRVALKGATVVSYCQSGAERLFTSSASDISTKDPLPVRGGVPICWPIFGPPPEGNEIYAKLKQHGFARSSVWEFDRQRSQCNLEQGVKAVFTLGPDSTISALFSLPFSLEYTVELLPTGLNLSLSVHSPSSAIAPLPFQALLHAYFRLPRHVLPPSVRASPLENLSYTDKVHDGGREEFVESRKVVTVDGPKGEVDRVYLRAPDKLKLSFDGDGAQSPPSSVELKKKNLADVVLWNPGPEKATTIKDLEPTGQERYVCFEPGQTSSWVTLEPGQSWTGSLHVRFNDNDRED
ncbi:hypothetical protein JCM3766R1_004745 [Sporobolomyces carnicolor]